MKVSKSIYDVAELLIDSHHGIYIPQFFAEQFADQLTDEEKEDLSDPYNEYYWDTWDNVLNKIFIYEGKEFTLWHDDDLWLVPADATFEIDFD